MRSLTFMLGAAFLLSACGGGGEEGSSEQATTAEAGPEEAAPPPTGQEMPPPQVTAAPQEVGDTSAQGILRIVGADPLAQPVLHSGAGETVQSIGIQGALRTEIAGLSGLELRVWGRAVPNRPPPPLRAIDVARYEIVSVNGEKPMVGTVVARDGAYWLTAEDTLMLAGTPGQFADLAGARVWIVGPRQGDTLRVQVYGIIGR